MKGSRSKAVEWGNEPPDYTDLILIQSFLTSNLLVSEIFQVVEVIMSQYEQTFPNYIVVIKLLLFFSLWECKNKFILYVMKNVSSSLSHYETPGF